MKDIYESFSDTLKWKIKTIISDGTGKELRDIIIPVELHTVIHTAAEALTKVVVAFCLSCGYDPYAPDDEEEDDDYDPYWCCQNGWEH